MSVSTLIVSVVDSSGDSDSNKEVSKATNEVAQGTPIGKIMKWSRVEITDDQTKIMLNIANATCNGTNI